MLKYAKITDETTKKCEVGIGTNALFYQSIGMTEQDVEKAFNGLWYISGYAPQKPAPTYDEVKEIRASLYRDLVDPITSHIQRLRDEESPDEEKIAELIQERSELVTKIQEENPYPDELGK